MKSLFSDVFDILFSLFLFFMIGYAALCLLAYTAFSADAQLKHNIESLTKNERVVAITILAEARSEGKAGMYAVASVIEQRAKNRKMKPMSICLQPKQFSCWNTGRGHANGERTRFAGLLWSRQGAYAMALAAVVCRPDAGLDLKWNKNADHYYSKALMRKPPYWAKGIKPTHTIKSHVFYKLRK